MEIDTRFLKPHPATVAWFERRETCRVCAYAEITPDAPSTPSSATVMRCAAARRRVGGYGKGKTVHPYCIEERDEGGGCGPDAAKFKAKP